VRFLNFKLSKENSASKWSIGLLIDVAYHTARLPSTIMGKNKERIEMEKMMEVERTA
jgi:hypothetical protein